VQDVSSEGASSEGSASERTSHGGEGGVSDNPEDEYEECENEPRITAMSTAQVEEQVWKKFVKG